VTTCEAIACHADAVTLVGTPDGQRALCAEHALGSGRDYSLEVFD
jgi:hypothetical protein